MSNQDVEQKTNIPEGSSETSQPSMCKHSTTGIISTIIGFVDIAIFGISSFVGYRGTNFDLASSLELVVLCVVPFFWLTGLVLAIIALIRKKDRKLFPILGLVINTIYLCPIVLMVFTFLAGG